MTVIIKELVVKTTIVENKNSYSNLDTVELKNHIVKECLQKLKKTKRSTIER